MAWWVARVTMAANAWGPQTLRDSDSAPRGRRRRPAGSTGANTRPRRIAEAIPVALGGHDVMDVGMHLARRWQCRCCHKTAAKRAPLLRTRCPGSSAAKWAQVAALSASAGATMGGGHALVVTGHMVWCWVCGSCACVRVRNLAKPCEGHARAWMAQARQRLLLGLHPHTRVPLGDVARPMPGETLPFRFNDAVRAVHCHCGEGGAPATAHPNPCPSREQK